ncbi:hypothetical protein [Salarchaeum japonicum]|uniref:hypothetical protein n=1 Tax=Salarchaeum japonicum TaxID=555573 RepID=UPI003C71A0D6
MQKRQFLTAVGGTLAASSLAGCLGYTVKSTSEIEDMENQLEKKSGEIAELENQIENQSTQISSLESEVSTQSDEIEGLRSDLDGSKDRQVLYLYSYGLTSYNNGVDKYNSGLSYAQEESYSSARAEFNVAAGYFDSAATNFEAAKSRAEELNETSVSNWCDDTYQNAYALTSAVGDYQVAMAAYARNRDSTAQDYLDQGDSHYQTAQSYEVRDRSTLENELGISLDDA